MKALFVIHTPDDPLSAVYLDTVRRAEALRGAGHTAEVLALDHLGEDHPRLRGLHPRWRPLWLPFLLAARLRRERYDLVVFHSWTGWVSLLPPRRLRSFVGITQLHGLEPLAYAAVLAEEKRSGRPLRWRTRGFYGGVVGLLVFLGCRRADAVFCLNQREERWLSRRRWVRPGRVFLNPNPAPDGFERDGPAALRPPGEPQRWLFLGQWISRKGVADLAAAFGDVVAEATRTGREPPELTCLGTRVPEETVLADFSTAVRDRVRVVPMADRETVRRELLAADVFVFPSVGEGSSLALLEAMAAGLAPVVTRVGAAEDLLEDGVSALLVPPASRQALVGALTRVLTDDALRRRLGAAAAERARGLTWSRLRPGWVRLVEQLVAAGGASIGGR